MLSGEQLKRIRLMRGISQSQIANAMGLTNRYIIYIEQGQREMSQETYDKYIKALYDDETKNASKTRKTKMNKDGRLKKNRKVSD